MLDPVVSNQINALQSQLRNDPMIERTAREQWAKMCRSIPLGGEKTGLPPLWLEMRPIRAAAAQPQVDARNVTITVGVQAETRIMPNETKPNCPFPAQLELVPPMQDGMLAVGVPIDVPFTELNKLIEAQLKGRHFPDDGSGPVDVEVLRASIAAAGDRLLISLRVKARENKSWFGFGTEATVQIWGKPALDPQNQILRLTDISLAVELEAAFGLLGTAARAAMPYLQKALADKAMVDLKPFANDARTKIAAALDGIPAGRQWRAGRRLRERRAPHRHRIRCEHAARYRGSQWLREGGGVAIARDVTLGRMKAGIQRFLMD